jgi:hypothetical protein
MRQRRVPPPSVRSILLGAAALLLHPAAAGAEPFLARYEARAAGLGVMRVEALFDLDAPGGGYRITARLRPVGVAALFGGEQVTSVEGRWRGAEPVPARFRMEGTSRTGRRHVAMDYDGPGGMPVLRALVPPNDAEREAVPPELQRGTMDALSALAKLTRTVARTGRCDDAAATFDGRRRADYVVRTAGTELLPPDGAGAYAGQALRCAFEGRLIAGRRAGQDPEEAARPHPATAWIARVPGASTPVPVRIDLPSRWFGAVRVMLVGIEPAEVGGPSARRGDQAFQQPR